MLIIFYSQRKYSAGFAFHPHQIGSEPAYPISAIDPAAAKWTESNVRKMTVLYCPQISTVLPSDSLHLADTDKAQPQ